MSARNLKNLIGGEWVSSTGTEILSVRNPATTEIIAGVPLSKREDVNQAVTSAQKAFQSWRATPPIKRSRVFFTLKHLLEENFEDLAKIVTQEHGKTIKESRGSVRRAIENVEVATGIPSLMQGKTLEDVASGIDCSYVRQPIGVFSAIAPYNFPAMVPLWFFPYAVACGNTFIVKPSEQVPLSQTRIFELCEEAGFPPGVLNLVHGGQEVVEAFCEHPGIQGVSFVGSSPVAKRVYELASSHGKRVQALGGAKNFIVVMPDADMEKSAENIAESAFGCAGQRCLAGSLIITVGDAYKPFREKFLEKAKQCRVGDGSREDVSMGPLISERHLDRVLSFIAKGVEEGAKLLLDGRDRSSVDLPEKGYFVGPTIFDEVTPEMTIFQEEIFGPVPGLVRAETLEKALQVIHSHPLANAASIFTSSGKAAREFQYRIDSSMVGVNIGVAAPMSFFPFGGAKGSFFGSLKAHGQDGIEFFTDKKVTISRWY